LPAWNADGRELLVPADFAEASFPYASRLQRGFEPDAVRDFLRVAGETVAWLMRECRRFEESADRLQQLVRNGDNGSAAVSEDASVRAVHALARAQATADQAIRDAMAYSARLTADARQRYHTIMDQAREKAEELASEAADRGRAAAEQALAASPTAGQQTAEELATQLAAARAELAYFEAHADVYRSHLRLMAEATIRSMDEWEVREKTAVRNTGRGLTSAEPTADSAAIDGYQPQSSSARFQFRDATRGDPPHEITERAERTNA
jgi:cell division septum initiation protein DivIVA